MDTRLKNNKKALHTAIAIVVLAAACFAVIALNLKDKVDNYYMTSGSDFEEESFIGILFQSNYVLYPEVLERGGKSSREEDLYLAFEETELPKVTALDGYFGNEIIYRGSSEQIQAEQVAELKNNLLRTNSLYVTQLGLKMDYCVIDEDTQMILKNTAREIEQLKDGADQEYVYYFIVCYDRNGNIYDIRVRGSNAEQFLKNAQAIANSTDSLPLCEEQKTTDYVLVGEDEHIHSKMTITQNGPKNATFIYAMTAEQMEDFSWMPVYVNHNDTYVSYFIGNNSKEVLYGRLGAGRIYLLFLVVITAIFFFLARRMPQNIADTAGTRYSAELIFMILWILSLVLDSSIVGVIFYVNEVLSMMVIVKFYILMGGMIFIFGIWYWCLLSIRDIFCGLRSFIRKRSLFYRYWKKFKGCLQTIRDRWKAELAGVDLGKDTTRLLKGVIIVQFVLMSLVCCFWFLGFFIMIGYSFVLYFALRHYLGKIQNQYRTLMQATNAIAQGKFENSFEGDFGIFESYKNELYQIQGGFRAAVEEEVKSQRMKTELITNVSHDLKTPLTAIITYIDLLKGESVTEEQRRSYLDTLERKSLRLKVLIEDLFEISKASSGNVKLEPVAVDICNLIRQVYLEHEDKMAANGFDMRFEFPEEKVILQLDSQKTYRIFENLYVNIMKYAMPNTRIYAQVKSIVVEGDQNEIGSEKCGGEKTSIRKVVHIELKNISAQELTVNPTDLTERFVRGDTARNTEGSGLGLAIAKSFTELQGGRFHVEIDGDLFKAVLEWELTSIQTLP